MTPSSNAIDRLFELFTRRPFAVFFRIFIIVYAFEKGEFLYIVLFIIAVSIWVIESIALYIDPKLYRGKLIGLANLLFLVLVASIATYHVAPIIEKEILLLTR